MKQFITESGSRVKTEDVFEVDRTEPGFFLQFSSRGLSRVFSGIQLARRECQYFFLHRVAKLSDKGNQTVVPESEKRNASRSQRAPLVCT